MTFGNVEDKKGALVWGRDNIKIELKKIEGETSICFKRGILAGFSNVLMKFDLLNNGGKFLE